MNFFKNKVIFSKIALPILFLGFLVILPASANAYSCNIYGDGGSTSSDTTSLDGNQTPPIYSFDMTVSASSSSITVGQFVTFTALTTGNTPAGLTYSWQGCDGLGSQCGKTYSDSGYAYVTVDALYNGELVCESGASIVITDPEDTSCTSTSCGEDTKIGVLRCIPPSGNVYQKWKINYCGSSSHQCETYNLDRVDTICPFTKPCQPATSTTPAKCLEDSQACTLPCPQKTKLDGPFCSVDGDVNQTYKVSECVSGKCESTEEDEEIQDCPADKPCQDDTKQCGGTPGGCTADNVAEKCGVDGFIVTEVPQCGEYWGEYNWLFKNYTKHSCTNNTCQSETTLKKYEECPEGYTCAAGECLPSNKKPVPKPGKECIYPYYSQCSGNGVWQYDSCNVKRDIVKQCTVNQICKTDSLTCVDLPKKKVKCTEATVKEDCGEDTLIDGPFCKLEKNAIYQRKNIWTCENPNTVNSRCYEYPGDIEIKECAEDYICEGADHCYEETTEEKTDCGCQDGFTGEPMCSGRNPQKIFQTFVSRICPTGGTKPEDCTDSTPELREKDTCKSDERCELGKCVPKKDPNAKYGCKDGKCVPVTGKEKDDASCSDKGDGDECEDKAPRCNPNWTCVEGSNVLKWPKCDPEKGAKACKHMACDTKRGKCYLANGPGNDEPSCEGIGAGKSCSTYVPRCNFNQCVWSNLKTLRICSAKEVENNNCGSLGDIKAINILYK